MPLLNYTTQVAVGKTVSEIQSTLAKAGAKAIMTDYENGNPTGIHFLIDTRFGERPFRLPCDSVPVEKVLNKQRWEGKIPPRYATSEQAARVAWRIVKDWIEAQIALIETQMVTLDEVMLPYMLQGDQTVYQMLVERQLALPEGKP